MKRLSVMAILLGALMLVFALPFVLLLGGLLMSFIVGHNGINGWARGFTFGISRTRIAIWIFILALAVFALGAPGLFRRRNSN